MKKTIKSIIFISIIFISLSIASQPVLAEFSRGRAQNGRFDSTTIVLDRTFRQPAGYIRKRELRNTTPLSSRVNVYDGYGRKKGFAKKAVRANGLDVYDKSGKKVGFYRNY